jgi:hypothetical protein
MTGYTRQAEADIVAGSLAKASSVNAEYNALASAFDGTTGHTHTGSAGDGAPIPLATSVTGILSTSHGGTSASTVADARANLGLEIGTDVLAYSARLSAIDALTPTDSNFIVGNGSTWVAESGSTARTSLGLGSLATQSGTFSGSHVGDTTGTNTGDQNIFSTVAVSGQSNVVADTTSDTLTLVSGNGITLTTDASADSVTITNSQYQSFSEVSASFTLALTDNFKTYNLSHASTTITVTIPTNASVAFPTGTQISFIRGGDATCSFSASGGVTLNTVSGGGTSILDKYTMAALIKTGTDTWLLVGNV